MLKSSKPFVDLEALRATQDAVRKQPSLGKVTFKMSGKSKGGLAITSATGSLVQNGSPDKSREGKFTLISDEPKALLGGDTGVSPAEYALQALAGCYTVTLASMAASKGIELDSIEIDLGFDIDLNGFLGLDETVRKGAQGINVDVKLTSGSASDAQLRQLVQELPNNSPLHDTLANPVKVTTKLVEA